MSSFYYKNSVELISISLLILITIIQFILIVSSNDGLLVYTLDDPYIHMALAENIKQGHYGINLSEFSAPSSSILWPFILAAIPTSVLPIFFLNLIFSIFTLTIFIKILNVSAMQSQTKNENLIFILCSVLFILATNMVGLIFTGMEHALQVLIVAIIAYGLILHTDKHKVPSWLLISIIIAPLIRYESIAISLAALLYLSMQKYYFSVAIISIALALIIVSFSFFLTSMGLDYLPNSISAKSNIVQGQGALNKFIENLINSLRERQGVVLSFAILTLLYYFLWGAQNKKRQLALIAILAVIMHFLAGRYGWYHRYEIYILVFIIIILFHLYLPVVFKNLDASPKLGTSNITASCLFFGTLSVFIGAPYIYGLTTIHKASNNIYEQQFQMHRFAVDYYNEAVAVNDLGYVAYNNDNFILDLGGLASKEALQAKFESKDGDWIDKLVVKNSIGLIMIYDDWFNGSISKNWIKMGELHLGKKKITPAREYVSFYAANQQAYNKLLPKLTSFISTLPQGTKFLAPNLDDSNSQ